ncbi:MAG: DUF5050 domain-containing protein [Gemmatimonadota bacterium]|nr:DUF5050 domain-containing protein [Gemmatimonadota bacterium]
MFATIGLVLGVQKSHGQPTVEKGKIYWTNRVFGTQIQRADLDGSNVEDLVTTATGVPDGIALDLTEGKMYWTSRVGEIRRANLDGSNAEHLITEAVKFPQGIALDVAGGKMYWTDRDTDKIQRANLDGSDIEDLVTEGLKSPQGIALDVAGGKMYWTDRDTDKIQRANLDGSDIEDLVTEGLKSPQGIALDVAGGKMYWTDRDTDKIQRANLDGSNVEDLITSGIGAPRDIALDLTKGRMYWKEQDTDKIQRANLDGSDIEDLFPSGMGYPRNIGIALDVGEGKMYWTDRWSKFLIRRADLDGSNVENLLTSLYEPLFIALDSVGGKMYWAVYDQVDVGRDASAIYRADLDGSNVENVVGAKAGSREFILDVDGGKIYWDYEDVPPTWYPESPNFILRADLDGSNIEDLVLVLRESGIPRLLDVGGGKVYWSKTDWMGETTIQRTELDDSNTEVLVAGISHLWKFVLDIAGGKIYWMEMNDPVSEESKRTRSTMRRANLDGSNVEDLAVVSSPWYFGPALEVVGGKIYWINSSYEEDESHISTILRADLDGSNIEILVTGISAQQLVLDAVGGKMYWTDWGTDYWSPDGAIQRANLDGSNVEILVTGLFSPSIALDIPQPAPTLVSTHSTVLPTTSRLEPNYPNPFNSTTQISYHLAIPGPVRLDVYNILGQQVHTLVDQVQAAGFYQVPWNARDRRGAAAATGVYLMRLHYPGGVQTRRLLLLK